MVADTDEQLKARVGWIAYFVSGMRHLHGRRTRVHVRLDDQPMTSTRLRSLLIGNCGKLPGGITLLPDAVLDDGWLDIAAIDTRGGIAGWAQLLGEVMLQGAGMRNDLPAKIGRIDHTRAQEVRVVMQGGEHVQVDGDIVGRVTELSRAGGPRGARRAGAAGLNRTVRGQPGRRPSSGAGATATIPGERGPRRRGSHRKDPRDHHPARRALGRPAGRLLRRRAARSWSAWGR